jgi:hypothetical protein
MKTQFLKNLLIASYMLVGISILMDVAQSASLNSGKTKKKSSHKTTLHFNLHNKSNHLLTGNGFIYKGSLHTFNSEKNNIDIQLRSLYFLKGNTIYIHPVKNKIIISKFKTPQKPVY